MERLTNLLVFIVVGIHLGGCSSIQKVPAEKPSQVRYSMIYIVHGDANYTYHMNGDRYRADEEVLYRAMETAQKAKHGEVFIFHQNPEKKLFFLFPKKDRHFYYYRNGELVVKKSYSPQGGGFEAEAELYEKTQATGIKRKFFLYFGHEIPSGPSDFTYHQSQPEKKFSTEVFSTDISLFGDYFDLIVLSTCNNGNPVMADALNKFTDILVASPQNLHLSHLKDEPFHQLETDPDISAEELANAVARNSFEQLSEFLHTMVAVAVYNFSEIKGFIDTMAETYREYLQQVNQTSLFVNNMDCEALPVFGDIPATGVTLYFKPAAFGNKSSVLQHSGWGCKE